MADLIVPSERIFTATRVDLLIPEGTPTDAPNDIDVMGQLRKASCPRDLVELGMTISEIRPEEPRAEQFLKAASPMDCTEFGMLSVLMPQPRKAEEPIVCSVEGRGTEARDEHPANASLPIDFRLGGRTRKLDPREFLSDLQFWNTDALMDWRLVGKDTVWRDAQSENAESPIKLRLLGRSTDVSWV
jgi:hypothetical protein